MSGAETFGRRDQLLADRLRLQQLTVPPPISIRHREYGYDVPAVDLDLLLVEYDHALPVAVIDFKFGLGTVVNLRHASMRALGQLHSPAGEALPTFVVRYHDDPWRFAFEAVNSQAIKTMTRLNIEPRKVLTEPQFVQVMYQLRGRDVPTSVRQAIA